MEIAIDGIFFFSLRKGTKLDCKTRSASSFFSLSLAPPPLFFSPWSKNSSLPELTAVSFVLQPCFFFFFLQSGPCEQWHTVYTLVYCCLQCQEFILIKQVCLRMVRGVVREGAPRERLLPFIAVSFFQFIFFPKDTIPTPRVSRGL